MTDPLADLYRKQRDLERLITELKTKKKRRQEGWAEMVEQLTGELNQVIEFRDGITTSLGGLNRNREPVRDTGAYVGR